MLDLTVIHAGKVYLPLVPASIHVAAMTELARLRAEVADLAETLAAERAETTRLAQENAALAVRLGQAGEGKELRTARQSRGAARVAGQGKVNVARRKEWTR